jgi:hypothetical protein
MQHLLPALWNFLLFVPFPFLNVAQFFFIVVGMCLVRFFFPQLRGWVQRRKQRRYLQKLTALAAHQREELEAQQHQLQLLRKHAQQLRR